MSSEHANMEIIEWKMNKMALFMCDISSEIFTTHYVPSIARVSFDLSLDDAWYFAILLGLKDALDISDLLNGRVGNADDGTL